jgi:hypothetical protein
MTSWPERIPAALGGVGHTRPGGRANRLGGMPCARQDSALLAGRWWS